MASLVSSAKLIKNCASVSQRSRNAAAIVSWRGRRQPVAYNAGQLSMNHNGLLVSRVSRNMSFFERWRLWIDSASNLSKVKTICFQLVRPGQKILEIGPDRKSVV